MADPTKAELNIKIAALEAKAKELEAQAAEKIKVEKELADLKASVSDKSEIEKELASLKSSLKKGIPVLPGKLGNSHLVQPKMPINSMTKLEHLEWRIDNDQANSELPNITADLRATFERSLVKLKKQFVDTYQKTMLVDSKHALTFETRMKSYL